MCGIAGIWKKNGVIDIVDRKDLSLMSDALVHRGPDGHGEWSSSLVAFAHRRLSIMDLGDGGLQPMTTADGTGVLVYNGEVYNFQDLRRRLEKLGVQFSSQCDSEVVLQALHQWGADDAVKQFNGMFAFAYFDARSKQMWLARDRSGMKSLSVFEAQDTFYFASEDKALLAAQSIDAKIDVRSISLFLGRQHNSSYHSHFQGFERLPPGALWRIDRTGIRKGHYYHLLESTDPEKLTAKPGLKGSHVDALEGLVSRSVFKHLVSDAPLATTCSGGVDSGLVTAFAAKSKIGVTAYVAAPDAGPTEIQSARRTADQVGATLRPVKISRENYLRNMAKTVFHLETGTFINSVVARLLINEQCWSDGYKVLMTGEGADELFGGYYWHRAAARRYQAAENATHFPWKRNKAKRQFEFLRASPFANMVGRTNIRDQTSFAGGLSPVRMVAAAKIMRRLEKVEPTFDRIFAGAGLYDFQFHMQEILHHHDRLTMAHSVEMRVPFLDNDLIEYAINLSPKLKHKRRTDKWLLKQVALRHIPQRNVHSEKLGFPLYNRYLSGCEEILLGGLLSDLLGWSRDENAFMRNLASRNLQYGTALVSMELMLRLFADGQKPDDIGETLISHARH